MTRDDSNLAWASTTIATPPVLTTQQRAETTQGSSADAIYRLVERTIRERHRGGGVLLDVGCGTGNLWRFVLEMFHEYIGVDVIRHDGFPEAATFRSVDLDTSRIDLPEGTADIVACVETIEHVENPRALVRELARLARPGGHVVITTPNQISLLSKMSLLTKNQFSAFQERPGLYPSHITALLPIDLIRIGMESSLTNIVVKYSDWGRIPGTRRHWPRPLIGQNFSDNVLFSGVRGPIVDTSPVPFH